MMVTFISECEKKALNRTRRVLNAFPDGEGVVVFILLTLVHQRLFGAIKNPRMRGLWSHESVAYEKAISWYEKLMDRPWLVTIIFHYKGEKENEQEKNFGVGPW